VSGSRARQRCVDIVGAGISGLATAHYLAQAAPDVHLRIWERDLHPGGLAGSFTTAHYTVEKFYHHLFRRDVALQELIAEHGLGADLRWRPARTGAYYKQRPYGLSSPLELLRYRPLPLLDRMRLGMLVLRARRVKDWESLDDLSVEDFIVQSAGRRVHDIVWRPLLQGKFGVEADHISAAWLWSKLVDRGGSRDKAGREYLGYLAGGLGRLFDAMVDRLRAAGHEVHLGASVRALIGDERGIRGLDTDRGRFETDAVVSGAQVPDLVRLLPAAAASYRAQLERIGFLGNVCLVLTMRESLSQFYWTNSVHPDAPFVGIIEQTRWATLNEFQEKHVAYISSYAPTTDPRFEMSAEAIFDSYLPAIRQMFPQFTPAIVESVHKWTAAYAQPIVRVGYRRIVPEVQSPVPNLFVCTMAQIYPQDRQVSNGVELARRTAVAVAGWLGAA